MSAATEAYDRLHTAMLDTRPECVGLDLFTADDVDNADIAVCAAICETCPLLDLCREYAQLAHPAAGIWAGKRWARKTYRPRGSATGSHQPLRERSTDHD